MKTDIEGKIAAVRSALQGTDLDAVKSTTDELNAAMQQVGQAVYSQQPEGAPAEGEEAPPPPEDQAAGEDTVEGEFREG